MNLETASFGKCCWEGEHTEDIPSKQSSRRLRTVLVCVVVGTAIPIPIPIPRDHKLHADTCIFLLPPKAKKKKKNGGVDLNE